MSDIDISLIQPGDFIEATFDGHPFSGKVWDDSYGYLCVGATVVRRPGGSLPDRITITAHTPRPKPSLPTTPGSTVTTRDGAVLMRTSSLGRCWVSSVVLYDGSDLRWFSDDEVLALDLDRSLDHPVGGAR